MSVHEMLSALLEIKKGAATPEGAAARCEKTNRAVEGLGDSSRSFSYVHRCMGRLQNPANAIEDGPALRQEKAASLKGDVAAQFVAEPSPKVATAGNAVRCGRTTA
jgi:hypothetical protein